MERTAECFRCHGPNIKKKADGYYCKDCEQPTMPIGIALARRHTGKCWRCGDEFKTPAPNKRYCGTCRPIVTKEQRHAVYLKRFEEVRHCINCGRAFTGTTEKAKYCAPCREIFQHTHVSEGITRWYADRAERKGDPYYTREECVIDILARAVRECSGPEEGCSDCLFTGYCPREEQVEPANS